MNSTELLTLADLSADLSARLAEHGVELKDAKEVSFVPEGVGRDGFPVRLKVRRFCRTAEGEGQHAAEEVLWIPLRSLPGLAERAA